MSERPRVVRKLASGGSATVFLARAADGTRVAVKRPHAHLFDEPGFLATLEREAAIAARVRSAHLVAVRGIARTEEGAELVMDYVEGCSLARLVRDWQASAAPDAPAAAAPCVAAALRIALDVCEALSAVHDARGDDGEPLGLVHRDVSPENVLVGLDGVAKLIDFGLARSIGRGDRSTTGGVLKGKAGYLAPEYVRGAPIDRRIDLFALGVVLWESLTRRRLFLGSNEADTLRRVMAAEVPTLAEAGAALGPAGPALDAVLARALARAPSARYFEARELRDDLARVAADAGIELDRSAVRASIGAAIRAEIRAELDAERALEPDAADAPDGSRAPPRRASRALLVAGLVAAAFAVSVAIGLVATRSASTAPRGVASPSVTSATGATGATSATGVASTTSVAIASVSADAPPSAPATSSSVARASAASPSASLSAPLPASSAARRAPGKGVEPPKPRANPY